MILGNLDLETNLKVHLYDTNKLTNFFINDFSWNSKELFSDKGVQTKILSNIKNINYESKNVEPYKEDTTSELFGALDFCQKLIYKKELEAQGTFNSKNVCKICPWKYEKRSHWF